MPCAVAPRLGERLTEKHPPPTEEPAGSPERGHGDEGVIKRLRRRWAAGVDETRSVLELRRPTSSVIDAGFFVLERNKHLPAPVLVGALASRLVAYMIPFFVFLVFAVGVYADFVSRSAEEAARDGGIAGLFAKAAVDSTDASDGLRFATLVATVFAALWAAYSLAKLVRRVHALVWQVPMPRVHRRWAYPLVVIGFSLVALVVSRFSLDSTSWPGGLLVVQTATEIVVLGLLWLVAQRFLPHDPAADGWRHFVPGALLFALGVAGMRVATVVYFAPRSATLDERYGPLALAILLLTWAYWVGFVMVASADLNAGVFRSKRHHEPATAPPTGDGR